MGNTTQWRAVAGSPRNDDRAVLIRYTPLPKDRKASHVMRFIIPAALAEKAGIVPGKRVMVQVAAGERKARIVQAGKHQGWTVSYYSSEGRVRIQMTAKPEMMADLGLTMGEPANLPATVEDGAVVLMLEAADAPQV